MSNKIESYNVQLEGTRPLLMHRIPIDLGSTKGKRSNNYDPKKEAEAALYKNSEGQVIVPSLNILAALKQAGTDYKVPGRGKKTFKNYIYAGVGIEPFEIPLQTNGTDPRKAWEIDLQPVVVVRSRVMRSRPRFNQWGLAFIMEILDPIIQPEILKEILESAGRYQGLCDFRPLFGLFKVTGFKKA